MKHIHTLFLLSVLLTAVFSCGNNGSAERILDSADSIIEVNPDSSLAILNANERVFEKSGKAVRMRYGLLKAEAEDKCFIPHTSDSAIRRIVDYYDSHGTDAEKARSRYALGRVLHDMRLYGSALTAFKSAVTLPDKNDSLLYKYKVRSYTWIYYIYEGKERYKKAHHYAALAYKYAKKSKDSLLILQNLREVGRSYSSLKNNNAAIKCYLRAIDMVKKTGDAYFYNLLMEELASIYIEENRLDEAEKALSTPFISKSDGDTAPYNFVRGLFYKAQNKLDSMVHYYVEGMKYGTNVNNSIVSLELAEAFNKNGNKDEALKYYGIYSSYVDSVNNERKVEYADYIESLENKIEVEHRNVILAKRQTSLVIWIFIISFVFISSLTALLIYTNKRKRDNREQQERIKIYWEKIHERDMTSISENEKRISSLEEKISDSDNMITDLQEKLMQNKVELLRNENERIIYERANSRMLVSEMMHTDVYLFFHSDLCRPTDKDFTMLMDVLNKTYNDFVLRLKELYPKIQEKEIRICCLVKINIQPKEICNIIGCGQSSLTMKKQRLYGKIFKEKGTAKDFDDFIKNF